MSKKRKKKKTKTINPNLLYHWTKEPKIRDQATWVPDGTTKWKCLHCKTPQFLRDKQSIKVKVNKDSTIILGIVCDKCVKRLQDLIPAEEMMEKTLRIYKTRYSVMMININYKVEECSLNLIR